MGKLWRLARACLLLARAGGAWAADGDPLVILEQARGSLQAGQKGEALALLDQSGQALWNQLGLSVGSVQLTCEDA